MKKMSMTSLVSNGISKLDLKRRNRMQVLKILKHNGPTSRIDIAKMLGLTRAAVTIITNEMIELGILLEVGEVKHPDERAPRGRKKILIDINYNYKFIVGVNIEEDILSIGLTTLAGDILDKRNRAMDPNFFNTASIYDYINRSVRVMMNDNCLEKSQIIGIGFGINPSLYDFFAIKMVDNNPDYSVLQKAVEQFTDLPVTFRSSVIGTAIANIDFIKKKYTEPESITFLQFGKEINFLANTRKNPTVYYHERTDLVNNMIIEPDSNDVCPHCGRRGCVKNEITGEAIMKKIRRSFSKDTTPYLYKLAEGDSSNISEAMIMESYRNGDKAVIQIFDRASRLVALLINNLYCVTNTERIVIHLFSFDTQVTFEMIKESVAKLTSDEFAQKLELSVVDRKNRFLSGCALAVRDLFFQKGGFVDH